MKRILTAFSVVTLMTTFGVCTNDAYGKFVQGTPSENKLKILDSGVLALKERLDMIKNAKSHIEVEYFIYADDPAGRMITQALIDKASEGIKVRILLDKSSLVYEINKYHVLAIRNLLPEGKKDNIEIKHYNGTAFWRLIAGQFRSHRKLLSVDDKVAITGGRNIADEYYDINQEYNFLDRDVKVTGPLVKDMRESFEEFWDSKYSDLVVAPKKPEDYDYLCMIGDYSCNQTVLEMNYRNDLKEYNKELRKAEIHVTLNPYDAVLLQGIHNEGERINQNVKEFTCKETYFYADSPGKLPKHREIKRAIKDLVRNTEKKILIESPYFVLYSKTANELSILLEREVDVTVLTNSLHSTDAVYVAAVFNSTVGHYTQKGLNAYVYKGKAPSEWGQVEGKAKDGVWGIHSKVATFDDKHTLIGTYNLDPRSRNINSEMAVICKNNQEIANEVNSMIKARIDGALLLNEKGRPVDGTKMLFETSFGKKALYWGLMIPSNIFKFLL